MSEVRHCEDRVTINERRLTMGTKIFGIKGVGGILGIVLPVVLWLIDRFWKKDNESVMFDKGVYGDETTKKKNN